MKNIQFFFLKIREKHLLSMHSVIIYSSQTAAAAVDKHNILMQNIYYTSLMIVVEVVYCRRNADAVVAAEDDEEEEEADYMHIMGILKQIVFYAHPVHGVFFDLDYYYGEVVVEM